MIELQIAGLVFLLLVMVTLSVASLLKGADSRYGNDGLKYGQRSNW